MEDLEIKYRLLTVEEVEELPLNLRICFFIQPWNISAKIKTVENWVELFWVFEAVKISDEKYFQGLHNEDMKEDAKNSLRNKHDSLLNWVNELIRYHRGE